MDTIVETPTTDIVVTDEAVLVEDTANNSFGKEIGKTLAISAASTAAMIGATMLIGYAVGKFQVIRAKRASKVSADPEVHVVTDLPETPEKKD